MLTVLQEQIQHEGENTFPELSTLCDEALLVYTETENILFGGRQVAVGQQSRLIVSEDNCNDHDQAFNSFGRPRKEILKEDIEREFATFRCWKVVARLLGVSAKPLRRRRIKYGMLVSPVTSPRISYSNITHKNSVMYYEPYWILFLTSARQSSQAPSGPEGYMFKDEEFVMPSWRSTQ